jgi:hypothetical protein
LSLNPMFYCIMKIVYTLFINKICLSHQLHWYQQNEQSHLTLNHWNEKMEGKRHLTLDIQACFETCTTQPFPLDNWISNDNTYVKFFFRNETLYQLKQQIPIFYNIIHDPHFKVISPKFQVLLRQLGRILQ